MAGLEVKPYLTAKAFWRNGKNYEPGEIIFLGKKEAAHLLELRVVGASLRKSEPRTATEAETGMMMQPETRAKRGRPPGRSRSG